MMSKIFGSTIIELIETESTNDYAKNMISDTKNNGTIISSNFQTKGKGHQLNKWESEKGKNITCSIVLFPKELKAENQFAISKFISLAITDYLSIKGIDSKIKWPNDIYVENNKIAGILIENTIKGEQIDSTIIGIGININQEAFVSDAPNPISLKQITNREFDIKNEMNDLIQFLNHRYNLLLDNKISILDKEYKQKLYRIDELTDFAMNSRKFSGSIKGVNKFGQLIIETTDKQKKEYNFKEISFLIS
jgi:BirA family transcriptional regulator, biotin operon repressor / biotin---[acetyl-CoA-carboxylase] ligase